MTRTSAKRLVGLALVAGLILMTYVLYQQYEFASATPTQPRVPGEALLAFDRPFVPATLEMEVHQGSLDFVISLPDEYPADDVGFTLLLTGPIAAPQDLGPMDRLGPDGCPYSSYVVPDVRVRCTSRSVPEGGFIGNPIDPAPVLSIQGRVLRNSANKMFSQVSTVIRSTELSTRAGKRSYFSLPLVGTTVFPLGSPGLLPLDYGSGYVFPPRPMTILVSYRALAPSERTDFVSPETFAQDELSWIATDRNNIRAHGSIVDTAVEDRNQTTLFVVGIIAGLIGAVLPGLGKFLWRSWRTVFGRNASERSG